MPSETWLNKALEQQAATQEAIAAALGQLTTKMGESSEERSNDKVNNLAGWSGV